MTPRQSAAVPAGLAQVLAGTPALAFAVLIGSRANGTAHEGSDWDIAVLWKPSPSEAGTPASAMLSRLARHEALRQRLAHCLNVADTKIDLIDLRQASLTMKAVTVEEGQPVSLNDERAWAYFQTATWRALEDHYWERAHAA